MTRVVFPWHTCGRVLEVFCGPNGLAEVEPVPTYLMKNLIKMNESDIMRLKHKPR